MVYSEEEDKEKDVRE